LELFVNIIGGKIGEYNRGGPEKKRALLKAEGAIK
jgi:hypothetical protein